MKTLTTLLKITIIKAFKGVLQNSDAQTQLRLEYLIINLHKERPRGSYDLKIMRDFNQRQSKGKLLKKSEL